MLHHSNEFRIAEQEKHVFNKVCQNDGMDYRRMIDITVDELSTVITSLSSFFIV